MSIANGTHIGPYQIAGWLGAGGMGDVYRARDARLAREVAIKVIAEASTSDVNRLHRFEQEARAVGQLNHPNILAVYDVGVHAGSPYIVSELLEGESLRARLERGALSTRKAIDYARQIAEGLATAHDRGIVHRDVKPENVFLTNDGRVKILDFGIAKLTRPSGDEVSRTGVPTDTASGLVIGTAGYMSPEQVRGEAVDARSDIFNVGTILYEMLTGRPSFARSTAAETMVAILREDPPKLVSTDVPPALERIVTRCLEKTREARFQSARDLSFALELTGTSDTAAAAGEASVVPRSRARYRAMPWMVAGVLALALAGLALWNLRPLPPPVPVRFSLALPAGQRLDASGGGHVVALSPNGAEAVYVASPSRLYLRSMSALEAKLIPGTERLEGVREPVFSPDGTSIVFFAMVDQTLKRIAVTGGAVQTICAAESPTGISWGPDGIVFGQGSKGIMQVSPDGGTPQLLVKINDGQVAHGPQVLPDGQHVLFTLATGTPPDRWDRAEIVVQSLKSGERKTLIQGGSDGRYVPTGHLVYAVSGTMYAIGFNVDRLQVEGSSVPMIEGVSRAAGSTAEVAVSGGANFSFSSTGSLVYVPGPVSISRAQKDIALQDRQGAVEPLKLPPGPYAVPRVSPDGTRIAFGNDDGGEGIVWIYDLSRKTAMRRVTFGGNNRFPIWAPDSKRLAFQSDRSGDPAVWSQPVDGGSAERLTQPDPGTSHAPESWSPNGETLLFSVTKGSDVALWMLSLRDRKAAPFGAVHSPTPPGAVFSPDGRWVAYSRTERGKTTIYVQPFPATGDVHQLVANASLPHHPRWSPDGTELFYNPRPGGHEVVRITTQPTFSFGNPEAVPKVFQGGPPDSRTSYDITPDGRFVGLVSAGQTEHVLGSLNEMHVVLNWFEELKARVPRR
jgi:serine/threonine-protein kinase